MGRQPSRIALKALGRQSEAAVYFALRSDLRPENVTLAEDAAGIFAAIGNDDRAGVYRDRVDRLRAGPNTSGALPTINAVGYWHSALAPARRFWQEGNIRAAAESANGIMALLPTVGGEEANVLATELALVYLAFGKTRRAGEVLEGRPPNVLSSLSLPAATGTLPPPPDTSSPQQRLIADMTSRVVLLARAGLLDAAQNQLLEAERLLGEIEPELPFAAVEERNQMLIRVARTELLLEQDPAATTELDLETMIADVPLRWYRYQMAGSLAELRNTRDDRAGAIAALKDWGDASLTRSDVEPGAQTIFWMQNRLRLAELLQGEESPQAASIVDELRTTLAIADPDHVVARALRSGDRLQTSQ